MIAYCDVLLPRLALTPEQQSALGYEPGTDGQAYYVDLGKVLEPSRQALDAKQVWLGEDCCMFLGQTGELIYRYHEAGQFVYKNQLGEIVLSEPAYCSI